MQPFMIQIMYAIEQRQRAAQFAFDEIKSITFNESAEDLDPEDLVSWISRRAEAKVRLDLWTHLYDLAIDPKSSPVVIHRRLCEVCAGSMKELAYISVGNIRPVSRALAYVRAVAKAKQCIEIMHGIVPLFLDQPPLPVSIGADADETDAD